MKNLFIILLITITFYGCFTIETTDGRQFTFSNLAKDEVPATALDTSRFVKRQFSASDYIDRKACIDDKRVVVPMRGTDVRALAATKGKYYIYFWNPVCPGSIQPMKKLDSLSAKGYNILILSERREYKYIDALLRRTHFAQYPIYTIETVDYTDFLLWRELGFIYESCPGCYKAQPASLSAVQLLLIDNGDVRYITYNSEENILR